MIEYVTRSAEESRRLGEQLGALVRPGYFLLLSGDLGAGKTTFVQGIAKGMGIVEPVTSPTFTLIQEYGCGKNHLLHIDPYRLNSEEDLIGIGFLDCMESNAAIAVEWGERLGTLTPPERLEVHFERLSEKRRRITLRAFGEDYERLLERIEPC